MSRIIHPVKLPYSGIEVQTCYVPKGGRLDRSLGLHRFVLGRFFGNMDQGVAAIQEEFVNHELETELALSGIREYVASLHPQQGTTGYDVEYDWQYLTAQSSRDYNRRRPFWSDSPESDCSPYHTILGQRVSTYDFAPLVAHVMTNTPLQNGEHMPVDPRLQLVEHTQNQIIGRLALGEAN